MHSRIKRNGSSRKWRALRQAILKRDNNTCYFCGIPTATTVDHLTPIDKGGDNHPNNLVAACSNCNYSKGNRTEEQYIKDRNNKARRQVMKNKHKTTPFFEHAGHPPTPAIKTSPKELKTPFELPKGVSRND